MKEKTKEILYELDKTEIVNRLKILSLLINNNEEYNNIMEEFIKNKTSNKMSKELLVIREKLFNIPELKEYLCLQNELRLLSIKLNNIIMSILN